MEDTTAILVDGSFYLKRAQRLFGSKTPEERADELMAYCSLHIKDGTKDRPRSLYRIFYYDCPPSDKFIFHPLKGNVDLKKSHAYKWHNDFFKALLGKRKVAIRLGRLAETGHGYTLKSSAVKKICAKKLSVDELQDSDFSIEMRQKGVDMKIGIDIVHLAYKRLATQIILVSGDSDFVPAAKLARREGIDFILDPMNSHIADDLLTHIDGLYSHWHDKRITSPAGLA